MASCIQPRGESTHALAALTVLRIEDARIVELTNFAPELLRRFGLPATID
jgi:hypothetical protein